MLSEWLERLFMPIDDPGSRLFHVNLLFAAAFILVWLVVSRMNLAPNEQIEPNERGGLRSKRRLLPVFIKLLFNRRYWWNSSTKIDYQIYILNGLLKIFIFIPFLEISFRVSQWTIKGLLAASGDFAGLTPSYAMIAAFTVGAFVLDDFLRFAHHTLMHRIPALWELHKLHHSAHVLTPMTLYRSHPVESAMATVRNSLSLGIATGSFIFLFESRFSLLTILGVNAFGFLFNLLGSNLRHSHIPVSFGWLEKIFISPKQHQIHHSNNPEHFDRNFGVSLTIWDRMAGSLLYSHQVHAHLKFGSRRQSSMRLSSHLFSPFIGISAKLLRSTKPSCLAHSFQAQKNSPEIRFS